MSVELEMKRKNLWDTMREEEKELAMAFAEEYCAFLDESKTEREFVALAQESLEELGFVDLESKENLKAGDKVFSTVHGRAICLAVIGTEDAKKGFNLLGAHVDSPRLDLKPCPIYEKDDMVFFKTHYYGGIKKYQWAAIPLSLHGVIYKANGEQVCIKVGEKETDPVFCITDLLPHLAKDQMAKSGRDILTGEQLNVLVAGRPTEEKEGTGRFKKALLEFLNKEYGIVEQDFVRAELEVVPAFKAKMLGFDKSFVAAYGQDDRVCAYTALRAMMQCKAPKRTAVCFLYDKEEIGSEGVSGAQSRLFENFQAEIFAKLNGGYDELAFRKHLARSYMLSTDVSNGFDPNFPQTCDPLNTNYLGRGLGIFKYTGSGGKGGASDASAELLSKVLACLDKSNILWQIGELGAVDQGGGGTICKYAAKTGIQTLDCGIPVLSMHAPYEITHTLDVYNLYLAYACFLENMKESNS